MKKDITVGWFLGGQFYGGHGTWDGLWRKRSFSLEGMMWDLLLKPTLSSCYWQFLEVMAETWKKNDIHPPWCSSGKIRTVAEHPFWAAGSHLGRDDPLGARCPVFVSEAQPGKRSHHWALGWPFQALLGGWIRNKPEDCPRARLGRVQGPPPPAQGPSLLRQCKGQPHGPEKRQDCPGSELASEHGVSPGPAISEHEWWVWVTDFSDMVSLVCPRDGRLNILLVQLYQRAPSFSLFYFLSWWKFCFVLHFHEIKRLTFHNLHSDVMCIWESGHVSCCCNFFPIWKDEGGAFTPPATVAFQCYGLPAGAPTHHPAH